MQIRVNESRDVDGSVLATHSIEILVQDQWGQWSRAVEVYGPRKAMGGTVPAQVNWSAWGSQSPRTAEAVAEALTVGSMVAMAWTLGRSGSAGDVMGRRPCPSCGTWDPRDHARWCGS